MYGHGLRSKLKRLEALENKYVPRPLFVIALHDGEEIEMTARECIDSGAVFVKVARGNNMNDLDELLAAMKAAAYLQEV